MTLTFRGLFAFAALAVAPLAADAKPCKPPLAARQRQVTQKCKGPARSCNVGNLTCQQITQRQAMNQACYNARVFVQGCFDVTDEGHKTAIADALKAVDACKAKFRNKKCQ